MLLTTPTPRSQVHSFVRQQQFTTVVTATTDTHLAYSFALSDLPNSTEFTSLFDQYKLKQVEVVMLPSASATLPPNGYTGTALNMTVIDFDDATALSIPASYMQYDNCMVHPCGEVIRRVFKPKVAMAVYSGAFTSFAEAPDVWLDVASPSTAHYGLKIFLGANANPVQYIIMVKYWIDLRATR